MSNIMDKDNDKNSYLYNNKQYNKFKIEIPEDITIVGSGIAGLTASIYLAKAGRSVTILEQSSTIGGRARTLNSNGFYFNQGPHALYLSGAGAKIQKKIGIIFSENPPPTPQYLIKNNI